MRSSSSIKRASRFLAYFPTLAVLAGLGALAYFGHEHGWRWPKKDPQKTEKKVDAEKGDGDDDAAKALSKETDGDYGTSSFDPTLRITHNPSLCKIDKKDIECDERKAGIFTGKVRLREMDQSLEVTATVEFDPTRIARIAPRSGGVIWQLGRQVGDRVAHNEILAVIDSTDVGKAKSALAQARAQLDQKQQQRARLQTGVSPPATIIDADAAVREARLNLAAAHQALLSLGLPFKLADAEKDGDVELARRLRLLGLPRVELDQYLRHLGLSKQLVDSIFDESTNNLLPVVNPLPVPSVVLKREGVVGETIAAQQQVLIVGDTSRMMLVFDIRQEDRDLVKPGQQVTFTSDGRQHVETREAVAGVIDWVSHEIDAKTRTVKARAFVDNPDGWLKANAFGTARIVIRPPTPVQAIPEEAIQWEGCSHIVFLREAENRFEIRVVKLGQRRDGWVEVKSGVEVGDVIAVIGSHVLKSELFKDRLGQAEE
jgi:cobalt-zinc-cadmium efflux system membrane fusion protein